MDRRAVLEARSLVPAVPDDERDQQRLDEHEDREGEDRDEEVARSGFVGVRRLRRDRGELRERGRRDDDGKRGDGEEKAAQLRELRSHRLPFYEGAPRSANGPNVGTRVRLPADVVRPFEVYVNGVPQVEGADYEIEGRTLVFDEQLRTEGKLGFWRWLSMWVGVAGTYRQNDSVDVAYRRGGKPVVATKLPLEPLGD